MFTFRHFFAITVVILMACAVPLLGEIQLVSTLEIHISDGLIDMDITPSGNYVYLTVNHDDYHRIITVDVSNPEEPRVISELYFPDYEYFYISGVEMNDEYIYIHAREILEVY